MSWWRKLLGSNGAQSTSSPGGEARMFPVTVPLIADQLSVRVYVHEIPTSQGPISCWSYVTDGLRARGHAEVVFTLRREPGEDTTAFPEEPCRLFEAFYQLAAQGHHPSAGSFTELGGARLFGHHLLYADAQPLDDVEIPPDGLAALLINDDELRAVKELGPTRVLARLGWAVRHYPFQTWSERGRRGLSLAETFEQSLLSQIGIRIGGPVTAVLHENRVTLSLQRSMADARWDEAMSQLPDAPMAFLALRDPDANACLVWEPGQGEPTAISPPGSDGSRMSGCCVVLFEESTDGGKLFEDGFAIELTAASWAELRRALREHRDLVIPATGGGYDFALRWRGGVDAGAAPGAPASDPAPASSGQASPLPAELDPIVVLLMPEAELAARVEISALSSQLRAIHEAIAKTYASGEILVAPLGLFVAVKPGRRVKVWAQGIEAPLRGEDAALLEERASAVPAPDVSAPIVVACAFSRKGSKLTGPPPMPLAWREASRAAGEGLSIPDRLLAAVWPD